MISVDHVALSFNQPKFCGNATWNATATPFAGTNLVGTYPFGLFVNQNNTVYVANRDQSLLMMWREGDTAPTRNFSGNISTPYTLFVTEQGDIYFDNGATFGHVDKWSMNSSYAVPALFTCGRCSGIFIDILNNLYCSLIQYHQVVSTSLTSRLNLWSVVAGTGVAGSTSTTLYQPYGVYVDKDLNLYVADYSNNRIQRFRSGQLNGTTVVASTVPGTFTLNAPTDVKMDADGYLFIVDCNNHRVIGSGPNGFRCVVGCSGAAGSAANQLYYPTTFAFDTYGNIFVSDQYSHRIQKFALLSNVCSGACDETYLTQR